jgi:hypothetical protein
VQNFLFNHLLHPEEFTKIWKFANFSFYSEKFGFNYYRLIKTLFIFTLFVCYYFYIISAFIFKSYMLIYESRWSYNIIHLGWGTTYILKHHASNFMKYKYKTVFDFDTKPMHYRFGSSSPNFSALSVCLRIRTLNTIVIEI